MSHSLESCELHPGFWARPLLFATKLLCIGADSFIADDIVQKVDWCLSKSALALF